METPQRGEDSNVSQSCDAPKASNTKNGKDLEQMKQNEQIPEKGAELVVGPEMLAEILGKKRMELLHSPEVKAFLFKQQSKLSSKASCSENIQKTTKDTYISDTCDTQQSDSTKNSSANR